MPTLPLYAQLARAMKEPFLKWHESGDTPPYLMVEKDGAIPFVVLTQADVIYDALPIVRTCYASLPHDALIVVHEARFKEYRSDPDDTRTHEQVMAAEYPEHGAYARLAREGKAASQGIVDCVCVNRVAAGGAQTMWMLPYVYSGEGTPFLWLTSQFREMGADTDYRIGGEVHDALAHACSGPTMTAAVAEIIRTKGGERRQATFAESVARVGAARRDQIQSAMTLHFLESIGCLILSSPEAYGSLTP